MYKRQIPDRFIPSLQVTIKTNLLAELSLIDGIEKYTRISRTPPGPPEFRSFPSPGAQQVYAPLYFYFGVDDSFWFVGVVDRPRTGRRAGPGTVLLTAVSIFGEILCGEKRADLCTNARPDPTHAYAHPHERHVRPAQSVQHADDVFGYPVREAVRTVFFGRWNEGCNRCLWVSILWRLDALAS